MEYVTLFSQNVWSTIFPRARKNWEARIKKVSDIIKETDAQLITLSEGSRPQVLRLKKLLGDNYNSFPRKFVGGNSKPSERSVIYKAKDDAGNRLWQEKHSDILYIPDYPDRGLNNPTRGMPWAHLVHAQTGQEVVLLGVHAVAWNKEPGSDPGGALKRERSGHIIANWASDMKKRFPDAVVIATGDMNEQDYIRPHAQAIGGDRSRLIPCIVGKELRAIDDIAAGRRGACPRSSRHIDMAFTNAKDVKGIRYINRRQSDHPGLWARIKLRAGKPKVKIGEG